MHLSKLSQSYPQVNKKLFVSYPDRAQDLQHLSKLSQSYPQVSKKVSASYPDRAQDL
jgi:hypothetical protein